MLSLFFSPSFFLFFLFIQFYYHFEDKLSQTLMSRIKQKREKNEMRLHSISISILFDKKRISGKPFRNTYCPVGFTETKNQRSWLPRFRLRFNFIGQFVSLLPLFPTPCKFNVLLEYVKAIIKIILLDYFKEFHSLFTWRVFKSFFFLLLLFALPS